MKTPKVTRNNTEEKNPRQLKRKLMSALVMLLIASILLTTTSYAWLVLSVAPEVSGISTTIGSNGSLEIALLTTETRMNMSSIRSGVVGESLANYSYLANHTWGNLVDLSSSAYGLNNIILMPSRLTLQPNGCRQQAEFFECCIDRRRRHCCDSCQYPGHYHPCWLREL